MPGDKRHVGGSHKWDPRSPPTLPRNALQSNVQGGQCGGSSFATNAGVHGLHSGNVQLANCFNQSPGSNVSINVNYGNVRITNKIVIVHQAHQSPPQPQGCKGGPGSDDDDDSDDYGSNSGDSSIYPNGRGTEAVEVRGNGPDPDNDPGSSGILVPVAGKTQPCQQSMRRMNAQFFDLDSDQEEDQEEEEEEHEEVVDSAPPRWRFPPRHGEQIEEPEESPYTDREDGDGAHDETSEMEMESESETDTDRNKYKTKMMNKKKHHKKKRATKNKKKKNKNPRNVHKDFDFDDFGRRDGDGDGSGDGAAAAPVVLSY